MSLISHDAGKPNHLSTRVDTFLARRKSVMVTVTFAMWQVTAHDWACVR
jgi:hypothetical protein